MRRTLSVFIALLASACAGPKPGLPIGSAVQAPNEWKGGSAASLAIKADWWRQLGDPALDTLVARALAESPDLLIAGAKIAEARAQFRLAASRARPSVALNGSSAESRSVNAFGQGLDQTSGTGQLSIAYEVDLFGRLSAATQAGREGLRASAFASDAVRITLIATVVSGYIDLRGLDAQLRMVSETLESRRAELVVVRRRAVAGYASQLEVQQAQSAYEAAARLVPSTQLAIERQENALAVLVGDAPGAIARGRPIEALTWRSMPQSLPSDLVRQRPDIAEAEARLAATDHSLDAARAAFMPRLSLTAAGGGVTSTALPGAISLFSLGGSILAPLFQGGALRAEADAAVARRDQAAFAYRKTVLVAFREVEDAMSGARLLGAEEEVARRQVEATRATLDLSRRRYRAGYASYLDQLDAERSSLAAELQLVQVRSDRANAVVALYRSLGGGWGTSVAHPDTVR